MTEFISNVFSGPLSWLFGPFNRAFVPVPEPIWKAAAICLFLSAIAMVFLLKREYVNVDAPKKGILYDLRLWTILAMLPHILIYLLFRAGE